MKDLVFNPIEMSGADMKNVNGGSMGIIEGLVVGAIVIGLQGIYELGKAHGAEHK